MISYKGTKNVRISILKSISTSREGKRLQKEIEKLKQEVLQYKILDSHIKKENDLFKEKSQKMQYEKWEMTGKLNGHPIVQIY